MLKKIIMMCGVLALLSTAACNTTAGVGRDIESAGDAIEDAAE